MNPATTSRGRNLIKYGILLAALTGALTYLLLLAESPNALIIGPAIAAGATLTAVLYFRLLRGGPPAQQDDYRHRGILRCGSCTRGSSDDNKVVYSNRTAAQRAARHYHRRFRGTLQEPYMADCGRWHLYTPH